MALDGAYWQNRYVEGSTGWDAGAITTPLKAYIDQLEDKGLKVLIPGAGNGYEAEYLHRSGFTDVTVLDLAQAPLNNIHARIPDFPPKRLIHTDFFEHEGSYDLIIEQTFFCAIDPVLRSRYVTKIHQLLRPEGKLVGVLWNKPMGVDSPPFGGTVEEYRQLFGGMFHLDVLAPCHNSIPPRLGSEVFINFRKVA